MRLAILISGSGSTAEAICRANIIPVVVISSTPQAQGFSKVRAFGIPTKVVDRKAYDTIDAFGDALLTILQTYRVDVVSQNGWLPLTPRCVIQAYPNKIINQHPGPLDPGRKHDFGGKGMYGKRVTCARIAFCWITAHDYWTESTVHIVTDGYDQGDLIRVERCPVDPPKRAITIEMLEKDPSQLLATVDVVAKALLPIEHHNVLSVLHELYSKGSISGYRRRSPLVSDSEHEALIQSKSLAQKLFP